VEDKPRKRRIWLVILVIVGLMACSAVSAMIGGAAGYILGRGAVQRSIDYDQWQAPEREERSLPEDAPERYTPEDMAPRSGAVITSVVADSPAERAGLQVGDVIVAVDGTELSHDYDLTNIVGQHRAGDQLVLTVFALRRGSGPSTFGAQREVTVTLDATLDGDLQKGWLGIEFYFLVVH